MAGSRCVAASPHGVNGTQTGHAVWMDLSLGPGSGSRAGVDSGKEAVDTMAGSQQKAPWALVDREDLSPVCPHCDRALTEVYRRGVGFPLGEGRTLVYFCPHCRRTLGFAQGRVF